MSLMGVLHRLFRAANPRVRELAQLPSFQCLSQQQLALLAAHLDEVKVEAGRTLIREGCPNSAFWVLLEGEVELFIGNTRQRVLRPGDVFGAEYHAGQTACARHCEDPHVDPPPVAGVAQFRALKGKDAVASRLRLAAQDRLRENLRI